MILVSNNAATTTVGSTASGATTINVADGSKFPTPTGGDYALATLAGLDGNSNENSWEIVKITARAGNALTVVRAQESTTAATWAAGTRLELRLTAGSIQPALVAGNNTPIGGLKTATFNSQPVIATTTGAVTIDWTAGQNQKQTEPTGAITYTFTAPPGPCHLQLIIDSDGTSTAQTITWPGSVIWIGATWTGVANKKAIVNFWYDGTSYWAQGANQV
jgi:hypothetical protein